MMNASEETAIKWVVGLDLLPDSQGALEYVSWLHALGAVADAEVGGVCILEEATFFTIRGAARERVERGVRDALRAMADASPAASALGELEAHIAGPVHEALAELASSQGAALIIGRQARRGQASLVRLGKVARRLLRHLPVPIAVVPPDLRAGDLPDGPVLVAIDVTEESVRALAFAGELASVLQRPLRMVHVLPTVADVGLEYLSPARSAELRHEYGERARQTFAKFVEAHDLGGLPVSLLPGPVIEAVLEVAAAERACTIVCGSRTLGLAARVLSASIGSELAATATVPVVVVPPDWAAARP